MSAPWKPEDARVRVGATGNSFLVLREESMAIEVVLHPELVVIVARAGSLCRARPKRELVPFALAGGPMMTITPGERIIDAFLRQA